MCGPVNAEQKIPGTKSFQTIPSPLIYRPRKQCRSDAYIDSNVLLQNMCRKGN